MAGKRIIKPGFWSRRLVLGTTVSGAIMFFVVGILFWGGFNTGMEATNTPDFCIGCHEMRDNVYEEYLPTIHYSNRTGVRAGCPDCHVPDPWIYKIKRKIEASKELVSKALGTIDTPEKFDQHRLRMARNVWQAMKETDSRECRNCHNFESMNPEFQQPRARKQHMNAFSTGQTCIDCHKGIAHKGVRDQLSDEELEAMEAPNPEFIREIPQAYKEGLARIEAKEAAEKLAEQQAKQEVQARIDAAVAEALANQASSASGAQVDAGSNAVGPDLDWSKSSRREITIFYPGTSSIEWMLGRNHGGKRAFVTGDRCTECHDEEAAEIGRLIVTKESEKDLEPLDMNGKRGSIAVSVESTYDSEHLYLRFSWDGIEHKPLPFVDGGKMDPDNPVKLAIMLSTDEAEFADRAGCWGTCHHDARDMPDAPEADALSASDLAGRINLKHGVTKYLKESRSKLELKGRKGKKLGGWDKLLTEEELKAEMASGRFMDIVRYNGGTQTSEDGYILGERILAENTSIEFNAVHKNGSWQVLMKRKLKAESESDISIEKGKVYNLGFAIHDDYTSGRFHHVSLGYKLALDNAEVELNAISQ
jgi:cytochrome c-type protein NapC